MACNLFPALDQKFFTNFFKFFSWHILGGGFTPQIETEVAFSTLIPRLDIVEVPLSCVWVSHEIRIERDGIRLSLVFT